MAIRIFSKCRLVRNKRFKEKFGKIEPFCFLSNAHSFVTISKKYRTQIFICAINVLTLIKHNTQMISMSKEKNGNHS